MNNTEKSLEELADNLYLEFLETFHREDSNIDQDDIALRSKIRIEFYSILQNFLFDKAFTAEHIETLINLHITTQTPFIVFINELNFIENGVMHIFLERTQYDKIKQLYQKCLLIKTSVSNAYLHNYIHNLKSNNAIRLLRLSEIIKKHVLSFYEDHIHWLNSVSDAIIKNNSALLPESDATLCSFGSWLQSEGKLNNSNNSQYITLQKLHDRLHRYLHKIKNLIPSQKDKYLVSLSLLEKMEFISLEIGTELALIDNKMMIAEATKDSLTGVLNRSLLHQIFLNQFEISQATDRSFILAMCDLDNFKLINDTHGHLAGDKLLKLFADTAKQELRSSDIIIRYGGEEFIIILPAVSTEQGYKVLDNLRFLVQKSTLAYDSSILNITVSIGMAVITPDDSETNPTDCLNKYLKIADAKLYEAKTNGRNRVR